MTDTPDRMETTPKISAEEILAQELLEKCREAELVVSGRQKTTVKVNIEKLEQLKKLMLKKGKGIIIRVEDFNRIFEANLTSDVIENNSKFYAYKNKIFRLTKDVKGRGIWMQKDNIQGYIKIGLK